MARAVRPNGSIALPMISTSLTAWPCAATRCWSPTKTGVFGVVAGHQNRHLVIDPKSGALYVGVGSVGNIGVEPEPKATIQRFDPDGGNQSTVVSGTRNPTALAFHPDT